MTLATNVEYHVLSESGLKEPIISLFMFFFLILRNKGFLISCCKILTFFFYNFLELKGSLIQILRSLLHALSF